MATDGFNKADWHWTRKGWKRTPKRTQHVKPVPKVRKRRHLKRVAIENAEAGKAPTFATARKMAAEKARAISAPTPALKAAKPTTRPPRAAWHGKYDQLTPPPQEER